jgi:hypothetical protein
MADMFKVWGECLAIIAFSLIGLATAAVVITLPIVFVVKGF